MAALLRPMIVKFSIIISTKSYYWHCVTTLTFVCFFVIATHQLHGIVQCVVCVFVAFAVCRLLSKFFFDELLVENEKKVVGNEVITLRSSLVR